jgi:hypothetical protein
VSPSFPAFSYTFSITYHDNVGVAAAALPGAVVEVLPPNGGIPIIPSVVSTTRTGSTDLLGDAQGFVVTYRFTPPGGCWSPALNGIYTVTLGGGSITDLAGNAVPQGTLGTFTVKAHPYWLVITSQPTAPVTAGTAFSLTVKVENALGQVQTNYSGSVTAALGIHPTGATFTGTKTLNVQLGVVTYTNLVLRTAFNGYTIVLTSNGLTSATTQPIDVVAAAAKKLVVTTEPPTTVTAGVAFGLTVSAEDAYGNVVPSFAKTVALKLIQGPTGAVIQGTTSTTATNGVAVFTNLVADTVGTGYVLQAGGGGLAVGKTITFQVVASNGGVVFVRRHSFKGLGAAAAGSRLDAATGSSSSSPPSPTMDAVAAPGGMAAGSAVPIPLILGPASDQPPGDLFRAVRRPFRHRSHAHVRLPRLDDRPAPRVQRLLAHQPRSFGQS